MKRFIDVYNDVVREYGEKPALVGEDMSFTYAELDEASGRVYAYLKERGIHTEDFVQIVMPRGAGLVVAMIGVIKAGAAFITLEDTYPKERINYIYQDCGCRLLIDEELFDRIMKECEPFIGNEMTDLHDAAYAVYTSGSTGNPKGVIHEYGNIDQACESLKKTHDPEIARCSIYAPFYFVAALLEMFDYITGGKTFFVMPHELARDFIGCKKYIEDNAIQQTYLPPALLKIYKDPAPCLKVIKTGSEPANGLSYGGNPRLVNSYCMSESGFTVLRYSLDHPWDVAPVGVPALEDIDLCLIDEDGHVVEGPGKGELCFKNEYVRGYINLEEQTKKAWRDGLYHTNDCVERDENGLYYVVGRFDDMIKINGNRVEPVEIEMKIRHLTGLEQVFAKGFVEPDRSYICAYYLNSEAEEKGVLKDGTLVIDGDVLKTQLPDYMLPAYYIGLDSFPKTPTGKVSRKLLEAPDVQDYAKEFVAPETELEKTLCEKMAEVLGRPRVSVIDDFYALGGDSMRTVMMITVCNEAGIDVTSKALYDHRTPRALAAVCGSIGTKDEIDRLDREAMEKKWWILPSQIGNIGLGWKTEEMNSFSITTFFRLKPEVDIDRLAMAANRVLYCHPGLRIRLTREDRFYQQYEESYTPDVSVTELSESEFRGRMTELDAPYNIFKDRLYRCHIFKTEKANYFYLDIHHVICDGTSRKILIDQITRAYLDDAYEIPRDYFFYMLSKRFEEEYEEKPVPHGSEVHLLRMDHDGKGSERGDVQRPNIARKDAGKDGSFFVAALAIACTEHNGRPDVMIKEVFAGRNEWYTRDIVGELANPVTVEVSVEEGKSFDEIREEIRMQELYQTSHPINKMTVDIGGKSGIRFNYQKNTLDVSAFDEFAEEDLSEKADAEMRGTFSLNIIELEDKDTLDARILYNAMQYEKETMEKFMDRYLEIIRENL